MTSEVCNADTCDSESYNSQYTPSAWDDDEFSSEVTRNSCYEDGWYYERRNHKGRWYEGWYEWDSENSWNYSMSGFTLTASEILSEQQEQDQNYADHELESHINAAGRMATHPFRDMRSAARARKRSLKGKRCSYRNSTREQADRRLNRKRRKREVLKNEIWHSQHHVQYRLWPHTQNLTKIAYMYWDTDLCAPKDPFDNYGEWDEVRRYKKFRADAHIFESREPYSESGELFSTWAQRRIEEMRAVKEHRLRTSMPAVQPPETAEHRKAVRGERSELMICSGDEHATTLPTNDYDATGHLLLRQVLKPLRHISWRARPNSGGSLLPKIHGFWWFGEFEWQWHRNGSGCWEIGQWDDSCHVEEKSWYPMCYCKEYLGEVAPEEMQRCSLLEWVGIEGRKLIMREELERERQKESKEGGTSDVVYGDARSCCGSDWSMVDGEGELEIPMSPAMSWTSVSSSISDLVMIES